MLTRIPVTIGTLIQRNSFPKAERIRGHFLPETERLLSSSTIMMQGQNRSVWTHETSLRGHCERIFKNGVEAVQPHKMIPNHIKVVNSRLVAGEKSYDLVENVYVVGFGKAVLGMAHAVDAMLGQYIVKGIISVPVGIRESYLRNGKGEYLLNADSKIEMYEGADNNIPDEAAYQNAMKIKELTRNLTEDDLLIVLMSGGGSALLSAPAPPITLSEFSHVTRVLGQHGATIQALNTIRKHIDELKGGDLARVAYPSKVLSLILSDVINDPLDLIASAPTVQDSTTAQQCLGYMKMLNAKDQMPQSVIDLLKAKRLKESKMETDFSATESTLKNTSTGFEHVQNIIVGSNSIALESCSETAKWFDFVVYELTRSMEGEARNVGVSMARLANYVALLHGHKLHHESTNRPLVEAEMDLMRSGISKEAINNIIRTTNIAYNQNSVICILSGGETTVEVKGRGQGGRNQEMALAMAIELDRLTKDTHVRREYEIEFLAAGTDGQDAATDATGAFCNLTTISRAQQLNLDAESFLNNNDSYNFFSQLSLGADILKTGITGTNVMDVCVLLIKPRDVSTFKVVR